MLHTGITGMELITMDVGMAYGTIKETGLTVLITTHGIALLLLIQLTHGIMLQPLLPMHHMQFLLMLPPTK